MGYEIKRKDDLIKLLILVDFLFTWSGNDYTGIKPLPQPLLSRSKKYSPDIMSYCEAKTAFIHNVVKLAL